jgi:hypothetical protein
MCTSCTGANAVWSLGGPRRVSGVSPLEMVGSRETSHDLKAGADASPTTQEARPRNTMSERSMSTMSAVDTWPTRCPRLDRRTVVILSIMA